MKSKWMLYLLFLPLFFPNEIEAQVLGPELKTGKFEIGFTWKWFHRKLDHNYSLDWDWGGHSIFVKNGINEWFTLSVEGFICAYKHKKFPDRDYRDIYIGFGIIYRFCEINHFQMVLAFHYNERFCFDRSDSRFHKDIRSIIGSFQIEHKFTLLKQNVTLWGGPSYVSDKIIQYPWGTHISVVDKSFNNLGFAVGVNFLLFNHIEPFFHIVYADFFQPRLGIAYQF